MDDFSVLAGPYICVDATQEKEWNSLHALMGIGKGEGSGIICIKYLELTFFSPPPIRFRGVVVIPSVYHTEGPRFDPWCNLIYFFIF